MSSSVWSYHEYLAIYYLDLTIYFLYVCAFVVTYYFEHVWYPRMAHVTMMAAFLNIVNKCQIYIQKPNKS